MVPRCAGGIYLISKAQSIFMKMTSTISTGQQISRFRFLKTSSLGYTVYALNNKAIMTRSRCLSARHAGDPLHAWVFWYRLLPTLCMATTLDLIMTLPGRTKLRPGAHTLGIRPNTQTMVALPTIFTPIEVASAMQATAGPYST